MTQPEDIALGDRLDPEVRDPEAPTADAAEQARLANPAEDHAEVSRSLEVTEWDAMEQALVVDFDDDYR